MMAATVRLGGAIDRLLDTYGFVMGDDQRQYFFLPSAVHPPVGFPALTVAMRVTFQPMAHPRGMRATAIAVTTDAQD